MRHQPHLALQRQVRDVLVEGHLDREAQRVPAAVHGALGAGRRLDGRAALADVLLPLHLDDLVLELDDVDHLRALGLALERLEAVAALRACAVRVVELARQRDALERELLRRAVPGAARSRGFFSRVPVAVAGRLAAASASATCFWRVLEQLQRQLQLALAALELLQLRALAREHRDQVLELGLLQQRHLAQPLDVSLMLDVEHIAKESQPICDGKFIRATARGDSAFLPTSVQPSMNSASSLDVSRTVLPLPSPHSVGEAPALELLHEDAQPGAIPQQHLAAGPAPIHEEKQIAAQRIVRAARSSPCRPARCSPCADPSAARTPTPGSCAAA